MQLKVQEDEAKLRNIQTVIEVQVLNDLLYEEERRAHASLEVTLNLEETFWKEKTRINLSLQGDKNTKFFHTYAKIKNKTKMIYSLLIDNQVVFEKDIIESHYKSLFNQVCNLQDNGLIEETIPSLVKDSTNNILTSLPTEGEIHKAILNLNSYSALGLNGLGGFCLPSILGGNQSGYHKRYQLIIYSRMDHASLQLQHFNPNS